jgi:hypothetical protein
VQQAHNGNSFLGPSAVFDGSENFFASYLSIFDTGSPQARVSVLATQLTDDTKGTFSPPRMIDGSQLLNVRRPISMAQIAGGSCIAYCDNTSKTMKAAVSLLGGSDIETIASNVNTFITPSAAVGKSSNFRVAYADHDGVKLASRSQLPEWTVDTVDAVSAGPVSLAYDNSSTAHVAYVASGGVKYARRSD